VDAEKGLREARSYRDQLERMHNTRDEERKAVDQHMHELEDKIAKVMTSLEDERARREEVQDLNKDLRLIVDKLRGQVSLLV
jgi:phage shock protein A